MDTNMDTNRSTHRGTNRSTNRGTHMGYGQGHTGQFQLMSWQGRFCPRCHVKVDLEWHPQIPCFCLNKDTKVLSNLFIGQLFYVIHVPLHHVRQIHLLLLCQAANMSRKRADKSCGHGKIIPFFPGIGQSTSWYLSFWVCS